MYQQRNVLDNVFYLGSSDRRLNLFENAFPVYLTIPTLW